MKKKQGQGVVVLGAGLAGLSAAYHAGKQAQLYEAANRPGGECVTDVVNGYHFDRAGHLLHLRTAEVRQFIRQLLPEKLAVIQRDARIRVLDSEVRYPIQANLYGLPSDVKADALRHYLAAMTKKTAGAPKNFLEWAKQNFGTTLSKLFFEPYNRKLWTVSPAELSLEWMRNYVPQPDIARVIQGAFSDIPQGGGYNATFWYPKKGGIQCLARALAKQVTQLRLQAHATRIDPNKRTAEIAGMGEIAWKRLISSIPLPALVALLTTKPKQVAEAVRRLQANSVLVVNLGVKRAKIHPAHWIYFPEKKYSFYRVGFPGNFGRVAPRGCSALYAEVALPAGTGWAQRQGICKRVKQDLISAGILAAKDKIAVAHLQYLPYAYVIFDSEYAWARKIILDYLEKTGILSVGRWGHWEYSAMEDALLAGKAAGRTCN
ncbi:FAD-dependent oxidoreductase [bacterium]|nr:FAD-dependent oxidoreductase [bacterium]